jgi:hypothetical protein
MVYDNSLIVSIWMIIVGCITLFGSIVFASASNENVNMYYAVKKAITGASGFGLIIIGLGYHLTIDGCNIFMHFINDYTFSIGSLFFHNINCGALFESEYISDNYKIMVLLPIVGTALAMWSLGEVFYRCFHIDRRHNTNDRYID